MDIVRRGDEIGKTYSFSLYELKRLAKIKNESFYSEMEEVIETITNIKIDICTNPNLVGEEVRWFSYKGYDPIDKIVTFRMDKYVQEIMLDVQEAFTTYLATNALSLNKGTYISLYELLKSYEYKSIDGKRKSESLRSLKSRKRNLLPKKTQKRKLQRKRKRRNQNQRKTKRSKNQKRK